MTLESAYDAYLIDLDGVVWVGGRPITGAIDALNRLDAGGAQLLFLTNDPRSARAAYARRLSEFGYPCREDQVLTSSWATAEYLSASGHRGAAVFAIGSQALARALSRRGLRLLQEDDARHADLVVVGGHEDFHYRELRLATQSVLAGAELYATNRDATFPMPDGPWPATGAILAAVEAATGVKATAIGKPEPYMFEAALAQLPDNSTVVVVGDRPDSDIAGGNNIGLDTILIGDPTEEVDHVPGRRLSRLADLTA